MSIARTYVKQFHSEIEIYYAAWLPTARLALGAYGTLDDGFFQPLGAIGDLGIEFDVAANTVPDGVGVMTFRSSSGVTTHSKAAGETNAKFSSITTAKAGLCIEFANENAFVLEAKRMRERRVNITPDLKRQILNAFKEGRWEKNYAMVWTVLEVPYANIVISRSSDAAIEFEAKGDLAELGNVESGLTSRVTKGAVADYSATNCTPVLKLLGVRKRTFGGLKVDPLTDKRGLNILSRAPSQAGPELAGRKPYKDGSVGELAAESLNEPLEEFYVDDLSVD